MNLLQRLVRRFNLSPYLGWRMRKSMYGQMRSIPFLNGNAIEEKENWFSRYLAAFMEVEDGTFVDVGVNLGQTLLKVKSIDPERSYVGFEASVECIHYARELMRANRLQNVTLLPVALADRQQLVQLSSNSSTDESASIIPGFRDATFQHGSLILAERGDDILSLLAGGPVGIVKIDVEGAELEVLTGLQHTMKTAMPIVTCEILPVYDAASKMGRFRMERQNRLMELMSGLGYACFRMRHDAGLAPLREIEVHADLKLSDYAFLPPSLVPRLTSLQ